jgi:Fur family ferric uptake transcriptional regulator
MIADQKTIIHLLKEKAINKTAQRIALLRVLMVSDKMLSQSEIMKKLNYIYGRVTIYRALNLFCKKRLIHKIVDLQSNAYYRFSNLLNNNHHTEVHNEQVYFKCINCGKITILIDKKKEYQLPKGFIQTASNFLISGYCNRCAVK